MRCTMFPTYDEIFLANLAVSSIIHADARDVCRSILRVCQYKIRLFMEVDVQCFQPMLK